MATPATSFAAVASGPIPFFDIATGQQTYVPLSAITFQGGAPVLPASLTGAVSAWILYLVKTGAIQPGPQLPAAPAGATGGASGPTAAPSPPTGATAAPAGPTGPTGSG
jgi:hypothetical protein